MLDWLRRKRPDDLPLAETVSAARRIAAGDLSRRFPGSGELARELNAMTASLETKLAELERLQQIRLDFVANVSHELRTPLTAIKGFVETLSEGRLEDRGTALKHLEIVRRHTDRIITVVDDLLTLSQMESAEAPLYRTDLDLASVVEEVAQGLRLKAEAKRVALSLDLQGPALLHADRDRLAQVASNLLDNAVKYTPEGGRVEASLRKEGGAWALKVSDTGLGIPPEHLPRIFERFYRVDKARSRGMGGTGLGLAIVKHIVQAHAGSVSVESAPGRGSVFSVRLPA